jgi:hypothetical protein
VQPLVEKESLDSSSMRQASLNESAKDSKWFKNSLLNIGRLNSMIREEYSVRTPLTSTTRLSSKPAQKTIYFTIYDLLDTQLYINSRKQTERYILIEQHVQQEM